MGARRGVRTCCVLSVLICLSRASATPKPKRPSHHKGRHGFDDAPPKPNFAYATELTPESYVTQVEEVANMSAKPSSYLPLVMFHVSWCLHCQHALPEFEQAAELIATASKEGRLQLPMPPKFFVMECDNEAAKKVCEKHAGASYPVLKLFRDHRAIHFNRPRAAQTIAWWSTHAARQILVEVATQQEVDSFKKAGSLFILNAHLEEDVEIVKDWMHLAFDFIEDLYFAVTRPSSEVGRQMSSSPSVTVKGPGLNPLPFHGIMDRQALRAWVNFNRFEPMVEMSMYTLYDLRKAGHTVVTFAYDRSTTHSDSRKQFREAAKQLRRSGKYLFAMVNMSVADNEQFMRREFPLVQPTCIFLFNGMVTYWENPSFNNPLDITSESIDALLSSDEARQDGSFGASVKQQRKRVIRFATGSVVGLLSVIGLPLLAAACCFLCIREMCASDDTRLDGAGARKED